MIYTASYFKPKSHYGTLVCISRSAPTWFNADHSLSFFTPSTSLLRHWKKNQDESYYRERFREQIIENKVRVNSWLQELVPDQDQTLLCWEKPGEFCHRNLVGLLVAKYRPDCWGGADLIKT